jgi:RNA polymerase sigma-70 factor (ECF subfamily)
MDPADAAIPSTGSRPSFMLGRSRARKKNQSEALAPSSYKREGMSELAVSTSGRASLNGESSSADDFVRAFNEVRAELVSTLFFVLNNHDDALDAAQDAFLKCWRNRDGLGQVQNLRAWIFRVGLNAAKDLQRSAWRRRIKPLSDPPPPCSCAEASAAASLENKEDLDRLRQALSALRPEEQAVFLLRQNGDLTYEEIAELRRSPVGTVKTQMRAALLKLKRVLKEK